MKYKILKDSFGYGEFRDGQEWLIDNILNGADTLGIMPTGGGKSLCYQVPALMFSGITLVLSPLISLMQDQVMALKQNGIRAAYINSTLTSWQIEKALCNAEAGMYKIIYLAPERLFDPRFLAFAKAADISMVTIDEAHCISQWGQDFRPDYLRIPQFIDELQERPIVSAFTATATEVVKKDIIENLRLESPKVLVTGFDRANLFFDVKHLTTKEKDSFLLDFVKERQDKSGIIYCNTRDNSEKITQLLKNNKISAACYHAGMSDNSRFNNQEDFLYDRISVIVCTNAFGMGIDKPDVSYILHYNMPKSLEHYYQEAGRGGRDGSPAECVLLYNPRDIIINRFLLEKSASANLDNEYKLLTIMDFYCNTGNCLRNYILDYFGEKRETNCENCGNCAKNEEQADVTVNAQKVLCCIKKSRERYGMAKIIRILRGSRSKEITKLGLDKISTYGIMSEYSEEYLRDLTNHLISCGFIIKTMDKYSVLTLGETAAGVILGKTKVFFKEEDLFRAVKSSASAPISRNSEKRNRKSSSSVEGKSEDQELFDKLKTLRKSFADEIKKPAFIIFHDSTLRDMCLKKPQTLREFAKISGVGTAKLELYGESFVAEIRKYLEEK